MTNEEIYALYRAQDKYLKFSDFIENNIEWYWEDEDLSFRWESYTTSTEGAVLTVELLEEVRQKCLKGEL